MPDDFDQRLILALAWIVGLFVLLSLVSGVLIVLLTDKGASDLLLAITELVSLLVGGLVGYVAGVSRRE